MSSNLLVFGEMLWDCLPEGDVPGGASMNVALHLHIMGFHSRLISAVGKDEAGEHLLAHFASFGADASLIQVNDQDTSRVLVNKQDVQNVTYSILSPVAWDFVELNDPLLDAVRQADALIFGTLGVRHAHSLQTLLQLLPLVDVRIFDANLRPPHYDFEVIKTLLGFTEILKLNEDELLAFGEYFEVDATPEVLCPFLCSQFPILLVCVTLGGQGAMVYSQGNFYRHYGYAVDVVDTIGAGDAFLSGFVKCYLERKTLEETLDFAARVGAYVAAQKGGSPHYQLDELSTLSNRINPPPLN